MQTLPIMAKQKVLLQAKSNENLKTPRPNIIKD
jgi:hypothetical protein